MYFDGARREEFESLDKYKDKYEPELWKKVGDMAKEIGGHGGMDFVMAYRLVECMKLGGARYRCLRRRGLERARPAERSERGQRQRPAKVPGFHARQVANPPARVRPMHRRNRLRHHDRSWVSAVGQALSPANQFLHKF